MDKNFNCNLSPLTCFNSNICFKRNLSLLIYLLPIRVETLICCVPLVQR